LHEIYLVLVYEIYT